MRGNHGNEVASRVILKDLPNRLETLLMEGRTEEALGVIDRDLRPLIDQVSRASNKELERELDHELLFEVIPSD